MKLIFKYLKQYKKLLFISLALAVLNQIFSLLDPQVVRILIDDYALRVDALSHGQFVKGILLWGGALVGTALVSRTAKAFQDYYVNVMSERIGASLYGDAVAHVFNLPYKAFEDQRSGSILLKLQKARDSAKDLISAFINTLFLPAVSIIFVIVYAFYVHWIIAVLFLAYIPVVAVVTILLSKRIKSAQKKVVIESAELSGSTTETLRNVSLVKSLGLEDQEVGRLNTVNDQVVALELKKVVFVRTLMFVQGTLINFVRVSIYLAGLYFIYVGGITFGEFTVFTYYTFYVFNPLYELATLVSKYQEAKAANEELEKILSIDVDEYQTGTIEISGLESIVLDNVTFVHNESEYPAVKGVSFSLAQGETIALVGASGSGKSTIIKLLLGLYEPEAGNILLNGEKYSEIDSDGIRRKIGYVSQETELFAGSIRENLQFVSPKATDEEMHEVLKQAQVDSILNRGEANGLDTRIGESGIKLSGGERQRLSIARALLRKPEIIIFDEATSALDSITEGQITVTIADIRKANPEIMMVMVAHRLSTIKDADRIYAMRSGELIEFGSHDELLINNDYYARLWHSQND